MINPDRARLAIHVGLQLPAGLGVQPTAVGLLPWYDLVDSVDLA